MRPFVRYIFALTFFCAAWAMWLEPGSARSSVAFTTDGAAALPQQATGDFDGDGRPDVAGIEDEDLGPAQVSVQLSGSATVIHLDETVTAIVASDLDQDGDLDLVASTSSGQMVIWINDGRGGFTRQEAARVPSLAGEPVLVSTASTRPAALAAGAFALAFDNRAATPVVVAQIRPPTDHFSFDLRDVLLSTPRAPPGSSL